MITHDTIYLYLYGESWRLIYSPNIDMKGDSYYYDKDAGTLTLSDYKDYINLSETTKSEMTDYTFNVSGDGSVGSTCLSVIGNFTLYNDYGSLTMGISDFTLVSQ